jgi:hypothetical protein
MARHQHQWVVTLYLLLALPDRDGYADRVVRWDCDCGQFVIIDGCFRLNTPLMTPEYWDQVQAQEQRQRTPEALEARRQQGARRSIQRG